MPGEVVDLTFAGDEFTNLMLANGQSLSAHEVVVALGTPLPRLPAGIRRTAGTPEIRVNPWSKGKGFPGRGPLLVIGTGLTMIDVATAALDSHPLAEIHAISRHGLVPPSQTAFRPDALEGDGGLLASSRARYRRI